MIKSYLLIAWRNLVKNLAFSIINISGMTISLASCILILLFIWDELSYDRHHPDGDRTFRIYNVVDNSGFESSIPIVPYPYASFIQKDFPEVENSLRMMNTSQQLFELRDSKILESDGFYAESTVFDMLTLNIISGVMDSALIRPHTIALSSTIAKKYFGEKDPIGESIKVDRNTFEITAIFADPPKHFHLKINYLLSFATTNWHNTHQDNWQQHQFYTYFKLKPGSDATALEAKLLPFVKKYAYPTIEKGKGFTYIPYLQNIQDIHLHSSNFDWEIAQRGSAQTVYILSGTAIMILVIACLNFINLSTARSVKRMKEVGIKKVVGAYRSQLVIQFTSESVLITLFGLMLAVVIAELALPFMNLVVDKKIALPYTPVLIAGAIIFCTMLGILAGTYPALHLSRFRPALVLTRRNHSKNNTALFRHSLVVLQFMFSFFLISGSWIVLSQNNLLQNKNMGFNKDQIVVIPLTRAQVRNTEVTKQLYSNHPNVINATISFGLPGDIVAVDEVINPTDGKSLPANLFCVDFDYIKTMGMKVITGRDFSNNFKTDSSEAFILNETAVTTYGFGTPEEAVGKEINWRRWDTGTTKKGRIVGVVQDFNFKSLREKISPIVMHIYPQAAWKMAVRISPGNIEETIAHFKKTYQSLESDWIFTYSFLDQNFNDMYKSEVRLAKLFSVFTYLAIIVACLGLFGLVEYSVNQRTKEISIRKVFGADVAALVYLLTKKYFLLLFVAFLLVIPLSYYFANQWLSTFAYRVELEPLIFINSALIILLITVCTVSFKSVKAALTNPSKILIGE